MEEAQVEKKFWIWDFSIQTLSKKKKKNGLEACLNTTGRFSGSHSN